MENFEKALSYFERLDSKKDMAACLDDIGTSYSDVANYTKALDYYQQALVINKQINNKKEMGVLLGNIGNVYSRLSEDSKALEYRQQALSLDEQAGNTVDVATQLGGLGAIYRNLGDYPKALEYYQKSLKISGQLDNKFLTATTLTEIGTLYNALSNSTLALEYQLKALKIEEEMKSIKALFITNQNLGITYRKIGDYSKALFYYQTALKMAEQLNNDDFVGHCLLSIGFVQYLLKNYSQALEYYKRSLAIAEKLQTKATIFMSISNIGEVYRDAPDSVLVIEKLDPINRYAIALEYFNKALKIAEEIKALDLQQQALKNLTVTYEKQNNYTKALETYKQFITMRDSIMNNDKDKKIARLALQDEYEKKEDSIKLQQQIADEKLKQQLLLTKQEQQQLQLNQKELDLSNKEKDLQKLAYLKTQSDLQNEQLEKQQKEKQLTISEKEKQLQQVNVKTLTQEKHLNALKQQQQWFYIIGGIILLGLGTFYFFYRIRLHEGRLKTEIAAERIEQHQKEAEFQRQLGDISLSALRSQMNPHFIFNCLNSIKLYTTQNDTVAASEYLTKFSRLIRLVLENSRNDRITLASELDALRLYMEMEAMRFKEKLKYNIAVEKDVDLDYIEIPPLLLQPYVENAIWHGLMQKEEGGRIDITVGIEHNESMLAINIIDNGIGRAKAAGLKSKTATKHKSYGMKVTSERLALINQIYKSGANVTIHDLTDNNGQASGTQMTIKIPLE